MHITLLRFAQSLGVLLALLRRWGCSSLRFIAGGAPRFASSLGDAPSLCSVTRGTLPCFAQLLGDAPSLRFVAGEMLPRFAQSLGGHSLVSLSRWRCSFTSLIRWGDALSLHSVAFHLIVPSNCSKICILEGQRSSIFTFGSLIVGTSIRLPKY